MVLRRVRGVGRHMIKCWDCGQELDTSAIERHARTVENLRLQQVILRGVTILRDKGEHREANALEALADAMAASPIP